MHGFSLFCDAYFNIWVVFTFNNTVSEFDLCVMG